MFSQKIKNNGLSTIGEILIIILLIGIVVFIFFLIRRPEGLPPIPDFTGLSPETVERMEEEASEIKENYPVASDLPYGGPFHNEPFFIYPPLEDGTIMIDIDSAANFDEAKNMAFDWLRYHGYNPDDLKLDIKSMPF